MQHASLLPQWPQGGNPGQGARQQRCMECLAWNFDKTVLDDEGNQRGRAPQPLVCDCKRLVELSSVRKKVERTSSWRITRGRRRRRLAAVADAWRANCLCGFREHSS